MVYVFVFNGFLVTYATEEFLVMYNLIVASIEGMFLGALASGALDLIKFHNLTIIEMIAEFIYKYFPILEQFDRGVEEFISSLFAIVFMAIYIVIFESFEIVSFIGGGLFSLLLPSLMAAITYLILGPIGP